MRIWLVNPFDPLPGDPEQEGRYATLARMLIHQGHQVVWWTSSFSHRFKRPVDQASLTQACQGMGLQVFFIPSRAYKRNISLSRLWNHRQLAKRFCGAASGEMRSEPPEVVIASAPPPGLALAAMSIAQHYGAARIIDVQDLWPETFYRLVPGCAARLAAGVLRPITKTAEQAYALADTIIGVADAYVAHACKHAATKKKSATVPLGIDLASFDAAVSLGTCTQFTKPAGEIWLAYTGSLSRSYDCLTIVKAASRLSSLSGTRFRFFITGAGELYAAMAQSIKNNHLSNVTLTGFLDFKTWAYLLSQCDAGFNASFPSALIYLPNKIFYYFAAGLAVLNTIPGQCSSIIADGNCGLDYKAGDVESCADAICRAVASPEQLKQMCKGSRYVAESRYDRRILYQKFIDLIEGHTKVKKSGRPCRKDFIR
ncbi:MAG: glycosyltransferase family 4 protein [Pseudomonadota bacterium]